MSCHLQTVTVLLLLQSEFLLFLFLFWLLWVGPSTTMLNKRGMTGHPYIKIHYILFVMFKEMSSAFHHWVCDCQSAIVVVVQLLSCVWPFVIPWTAVCQASLFFTQSLLKLMPIVQMMPSNHLILCHPCLLLPSMFPHIWPLVCSLYTDLVYSFLSGNSVRLYFFGLQNHCRWWLQPWN